MATLNPGEFSQNIQLGIEVVATLAFALSGILEGARKRLDAVGVCVVAFLAAFGGGTLRDLLLDVRPFFWVKYIELLWAVFVLCIVAMLFVSATMARLKSPNTSANTVYAMCSLTYN